MNSNSIFCENCGWLNEPSARVCENCQKPLTDDSGQKEQEGIPSFINPRPQMRPLFPGKEESLEVSGNQDDWPLDNHDSPAPPDNRRYQDIPSHDEPEEEHPFEQRNPTPPGHRRYQDISSHDEPEEEHPFEQRNPAPPDNRRYQDIPSHDEPEEEHPFEQRNPTPPGHRRYQDIPSYTEPEEERPFERDRPVIKWESPAGEYRDERYKDDYARRGVAPAEPAEPKPSTPGGTEIAHDKRRATPAPSYNPYRSPQPRQDRDRPNSALEADFRTVVDMSSQSGSASVCPYCQTPLHSEKDRFCHHCGRPVNEKIIRTCPDCQTPVIPNAQYCYQCGKNLRQTPQLILEMVGQPNQIFEVPPDADEYTVGRTVPQQGNFVDMDLGPFGQRRISRRHARFILIDGQWYLEDLDSKAGTSAYGKRLNPHESIPLEDDIIIYFGELQFRVSLR